MDDNATALIFEHLKSQAQFAYFQLGVAASAIAFAVHETDGRALRSTPWPIGAAVAIWAFSFGAGCFGIELHQQGMRSNAAFLVATRGMGSESLLASEAQQFVKWAKTLTQADLNRPGRRFRWQMWSLFAGGFAYVAGHVMAMAAVPLMTTAPVLERPDGVAPSSHTLGGTRGPLTPAR